jgi:hypothetical protein
LNSIKKNEEYLVQLCDYFLSLSHVAPTLELRLSVKSFVSLQFLNPKAVGGKLWTGDQLVARRYLHKHRINAWIPIHAFSGIRTHDPSVRASEDSSYLRPHGHCDRLRDY